MKFEYSANQLVRLEELKTGSLETEQGAKMELYFEEFGVGQLEKPVFERFLLSPLIGNRSTALRALVQFGSFPGYEAQAVLLHYQGRDYPDHAYTFRGIDLLAKMVRLGSADAERALTLLHREPYVSEMYGPDDEE